MDDLRAGWSRGSSSGSYPEGRRFESGPCNPSAPRGAELVAAAAAARAADAPQPEAHVNAEQVLAAAAHYAGWGYGTGPDTRFPGTLRLPPGTPPARWVWTGTTPGLCDCSTFVTGCLLAAAPGAVDREAYADLMLAHGDVRRPWSPVEAAARLLGGRPIYVQTVPPVGELVVVQLWRDLRDGVQVVSGARRSRGHSILARCLPDARIQVWESTPGAGVRTVIHRSWVALLASGPWTEARSTPVDP